MEAPKIEVKTRTATGKRDLKAIREQGLVPGVLYGPKKENQHVEIPRLDLEQLYEAAGESTIVDVIVDGGTPEKVLISEYQVDPLTRAPIHVDFHMIDMDKEISAEIDLVFQGIAPAVKELGGTLLKTRDTVEITCLPQYLVSEIIVDISILSTFDDIIRVKDLVVPEGITIENADKISIAKVQAPRTEEEMAALDEEVTADVDAVEVEGAEDEEGEEGDEGTEAPEKGEASDEEKKEGE